MHRVDLNADLGEGASNDAAILDFVSSANIACGGHAGDPDLMARTIELATDKRVAIGAHPGFPDREGFGRRPLEMTPNEVRDSVVEQIRALHELARAVGVPLQHVKPHGALYNSAATDTSMADAIATAVGSIDPAIILFGLAGSELVVAGQRAGLRTVAEGFADRTYSTDGRLTPRSQPGALIGDPAVAATQAIRLVTEGKVRSLQGDDVEVHVDTICIHGDSPEAAVFAREIRRQLEATGIEVASPMN